MLPTLSFLIMAALSKSYILHVLRALFPKKVTEDHAVELQNCRAHYEVNILDLPREALKGNGYKWRNMAISFN